MKMSRLPSEMGTLTTPRRKAQKAGYTLLELIIVMTIIMILTAGALGATRAIIRSLRFSNAINKVVFLVQQSRSLAASGTDPNVEQYGVLIESGQSNSVTLFSDAKAGVQINGPAHALIETYTLDAANLLISTRNEQDVECLGGQTIIFHNGKSAVEIYCGAVVPANLINRAKIGVVENRPANPRSQFFTLQRASGIPQPVQ